jgi:hypothetical protein
MFILFIERSLANYPSKKFSTSTFYNRAFQTKSFEQQIKKGDTLYLQVIPADLENGNHTSFYTLRNSNDYFMTLEDSLAGCNSASFMWLIMGIVFLISGLFLLSQRNPRFSNFYNKNRTWHAADWFYSNKQP